MVFHRAMLSPRLSLFLDDSSANHCSSKMLVGLVSRASAYFAVARVEVWTWVFDA